MQTKLFAATLLLILSQGPASLRAQNTVGEMTITGPHTKVTSKLKEATTVMNVTMKNVASKQHETLTVTREVDAASPLLLKAFNTKEVLTEVSFKVFKPGDPKIYKIITLTNATITKINTIKGRAGGAQNDIHELEEFSFTFQKITYTNVSGGKTATDDWNAQTR
jgi:type VI secretion system Hcp family effector